MRDSRGRSLRVFEDGHRLIMLWYRSSSTQKAEVPESTPNWSATATRLTHTISPLREKTATVLFSP